APSCWRSWRTGTGRGRSRWQRGGRCWPAGCANAHATPDSSGIGCRSRGVALAVPAFWRFLRAGGNAPWVQRLPGTLASPRIAPFLGSGGGTWNLWMAATVGLMAVSAAGGLLGAARIAGVWSTSRRGA
ncbi:MAG: hypothetical protein J2P58_10595, partial [Acidimicrobiaceae bacterium]|nr:hypothetical protein [Acidimicrobiaceae bacterium]